MAKSEKKSTKTPVESAGFKLATTLDITTVESSYEKLKELLVNDSSLDIDCSEVQKITTPGIQLIIAFHRKCSELKKSVNFISPSKSFIDTFAFIGLDGHEIFNQSKIQEK